MNLETIKEAATEQAKDSHYTWMAPDRVLELVAQLERANRIIGWMMPYIGGMCPPADGIYDLNIHCCENKVPKPGDETKGPSIRQHTAAWRPTGVGPALTTPECTD